MIAKTRSARCRFLIGVSLTSIMLAGPALGQNFGARRPVDPSAQAAKAAQNAANRNAAAQAAAQRTRASFERASQVRAQMDAAQQAARAAARAAQSNVRNGLGAGGLEVAKDAALDPSLWVGAQKPVESQGSNGRTGVTVNQTQEKAILTWDSFNVGRETDLTFNQRGNANWIALNRVTDPSANPTQILGSIKADGSVYIINPNGVVFGGASSVNVRNLVTSSLEIHGGTVEWSRPLVNGQEASDAQWAQLKKQARDQRFMDGLFGNAKQDTFGDYRGTMTFWDGVTDWSISRDQMIAEMAQAGSSTAAGVTVEAGAVIQTASSGTALLLGRNVDNHGTLLSPNGQVLLAAGRGVTLLDGTARVEGGYRWTGDSRQEEDIFKIPGFIAVVQQGGRSSNTGVIEATRGNISIVGAAVRQAGVLSATTGVDKAGSVILDASGLVGMSGNDPIIRGDAVGGGGYAWRGTVTLTRDSHVSILPDKGDQKAVGSSFVPSNIEILGNRLAFEQGSALWAPAGNLRLIADTVGGENRTPGRIYIDKGATIDLGGLHGIVVDMAQNSVRAELRANELADNPVVRDGALRGETVWFDGRLGDKLSDGSGIADLSGWYDLIQRDVGQFMTTGGSITMMGAEVIAREGSVIDLSGGSVRYNDGFVRSTRLVDRTGRLVRIEDAMAGVDYVGLEGDFIVDHARWGVTERHVNRFSRVSEGTWQKGYVEGRSAGRMTVHATDGSFAETLDGISFAGDLARIFEGTINGGVIVGEHQRDKPTGAGVTDMTRIWHERPALASLQMGEVFEFGQGYKMTGGDYVIGDAVPVLGDAFGADSALFDAGNAYGSLVDGVTVGRHVLSSKWFDGKTFGDVTLIGGDSVSGLYRQVNGERELRPNAPTTSPGGALTIRSGATVDLGDHGAFRFAGRQATVDGTIRAAGGTVSLEGTWVPALDSATSTFATIPADMRPGVKLGATGAIDVAGRWTNDYLDYLESGTLRNAVVDGGEVALQGYRVELARGSRIDVSGGAHLAVDGVTLTAGNGGTITLDVDTNRSIGIEPGGGLVHEGTLSGHAPGKGGTLNIHHAGEVILGQNLGDLAPIVDGVLDAGLAAPKTLKLAEAVTLPTGSRLSFDVTAELSQLVGGEVMKEQVILSSITNTSPATILIDWVVPQGLRLRKAGTPTNIYFEPGQTVPAGTQVRSLQGGASNGYLPAGFVMPQGVFRLNDGFLGLRLSSPIPIPVPAGDPLPLDVTLGVGYVLPTGAKFDRDVAVDVNLQLVAPDHFRQGGFASFGLSGAQGLLVKAGAVIAPSHDTLRFTGAMRDVASGANLLGLASGEGAGVSLVYSTDLPEWERTGSALSLGTSGSATSVWANFTGRPQGALTMEAGSAIRMEDRSKVVLNTGSSQKLFLDGTIETRGGEIALQDKMPVPGEFVSVVVGDNARLLATGYQALVDHADGQAVRGVVGGGAIRIGIMPDSLSGSVRVLVGEGALLDVSGVRGVADRPGGSSGARPGRPASPLVETPIDGAGGSILINAVSGAIGGEMRLAPGGETGLGGRLAIRGAGAYLVRQALDMEPTELDSVLPTDRMTVSADRISGSGADDVVLATGLTNVSTATNITFEGDVRLAARRSVLLESTGFAASSGAEVLVESAYVRLTGVTTESPTLAATAAEGSSLTVRGEVIDFTGTTLLGCTTCGTDATGFADARFVARDDIRLLGGRGDNPGGGLQSPGTITFDAAQTYVAPGTAHFTRGTLPSLQWDFAETNPGFLVRSDVSVTVLGNGRAAPVPLSWGGKLTLRAPDITQAGVLRAPLGTIALEAGETLTLAPGSLTSVSLEGRTALAGAISYLQTFYGYDRADWSPSRAVTMRGPDIDLQQGAVVDLSGGGDVIGYAFRGGAGGLKNILDDTSAQGAFAILPGYQGPLAAPTRASVLYGEAGWSDYRDGTNNDGGLTSDARLRVGDQVWLQGVAGLADGYYALLPAAFALLEGGMLVRPTDSLLSAGPQASQRRDDGSVIASGFRAVASTAIRPDQGWSSFQVMDGKTWRKYSDIASYSLTAMRDTSNAASGAFVRTPHDAGRLVIDAGERLSLLGTARLNGGAAIGGGKAGLTADIDITSSGGGVALLAPGQAAPEGYLAIDAATVQAFAGNGSLLLGGRRPITTWVPGDPSNGADPAPAGVQITTTAANVMVGEGAAYTGLELLLAASDRISVGEGARLSASGSGRVSDADLLLTGDGTLLRLSTGGRVGLVRTGSTGGSGRLALASGAVLDTRGSLALDASAGFDLSANAVLNVGQLDLASDIINLGATPDDVTGTVLPLETIERLAGAAELALRAHRGMVVWGDVTLGARGADGKAMLGALTLDTASITGRGEGAGLDLTAGTVTLRNSGTAADAPAVGAGDFTLDVDRLVLGRGKVAIGGYGAVKGQVTQLDTMEAGRLAVVGTIDLSVGRVTSLGGSDYTMAAGGALKLRQGRTPAAAGDGAGGRLTLSGSSVDFDTLASARAGVVTLRATAGDVTLGEHASIDVSGTARDFVDTVRYAPGGTVRIVATGDVTTRAGSLIDVSGHARGGDAGVVDVEAAGHVAMAGALAAKAASGAQGGEFALDAGSTDFGGLNALLNAGGFTSSRDMRLRAQDIVLAAGERLEAHRVTLRADAGEVRIAGTIAAAGNAAYASGGLVQLTGTKVSLTGTGRIEAGAAAVAADAWQPASGNVILAADTGLVTLASGGVIDLVGGRQGGGRLTVRAGRTATGVDAVLDATVTGAREKLLVGSRVYQSDTVTAPLVTAMLNDANTWLSGASAVTGWQTGAGLIVRSDGDLTVSSAIDLAAIDGPGWLGLEAKGDLDIQADISDGFASVAANATLDDRASFSFGFEAGGDITLGEMPRPLAPVVIGPGQAFDVPRRLNLVVPFTLAASWVVPTGVTLSVTSNGRFAPGSTVPAGTVVTTVTTVSTLPAGYVLPADAFPQGLTFPAEKQPFTGTPRTVRTGTGDILLNAGRDIAIGGLSAIYSAGRATPTAAGFTSDGLVLGDFPTLGGDIHVDAGRDIDVALIEQAPSAWLFRYGQSSWNGEPQDTRIQQQTSWSMVYRNYQFGFGALGGGDIRVRAAGDITDLAAALPTTGHMTRAVGERAVEGDLVVRGGGNLSVRALGDIAGGAFVLGRGTADLVAGGDVRGGATTTVQVNNPYLATPTYEQRGLAPMFGLMDASVSVVAGGAVEIESVYDLALVPQICENLAGACVTPAAAIGSAWVGYSPRAGLDALAGAGDLVFRSNGSAIASLTRNATVADFRIVMTTPPAQSTNMPQGYVALLERNPGRLALTAMEGDLRFRPVSSSTLVLSAAPKGTFELLAGNDVTFEGANNWSITMEDIGPAFVRNALQPVRANGQSSIEWYTLQTDQRATVGNNMYRGYDLAHAGDRDPARIYALEGAIGADLAAGQFVRWNLIVPKAMRVQAGGDIRAAQVVVTHNDPRDVSTMVAGGDLLGGGQNAGFWVYGPGTLWFEAGGSIRQPLGPTRHISAGNGLTLTGFSPLGKDKVNYALPDVGADVTFVAGTAQGIDRKAFADRYLDPANRANPTFGLSHPANAGKVVATYEQELEAFLKEQGLTGITAQNRRALFDALPQQTQQGFLQQVLLKELQLTGIDYNDADGPRFQQYVRGYEALHLLYPGTRDLGRVNPVRGDIALSNSLIETRSGGSINLIAPYGRIDIGDPTVATVPVEAGIFTRRGGDLAMLANDTIALDRSRAFTLQGGDLLMWTSRGDITAGVGAKTNVTNVPLSFMLNKEGDLSVNVFGLQTGSGIGVLDALEGRDEDRDPSRIDLLAFFGEVNAGDAGIRVVGDINIAALRVVNAANIQVTGEANGIPQVAAVNVGALNAASAATTAVVNEAAQLAQRARPQPFRDMPTVVNVRFLGFGPVD